MVSRIGWTALWIITAAIGLIGCAENRVRPGGAFPAGPGGSLDAAHASAEAVPRDPAGNPRPINEHEKGKLSLARLSERRGQVDVARQLYEGILSKDPQSAVAHHRLAVLSARAGKFQQAEAHFQQASQLAPPTAELLSDIGYCYYLQNRPAEAEQVLRAALKLDPNHKSVVTNLGLVLGEQGRFDESLQAFLKAGTEAEAYANLGYVYSQLGQYDDAQKCYSRALSLDSKLRSAALAMVQVAERQRGRSFDDSPAVPVEPAAPRSQPQETVATIATQRSPGEAQVQVAPPVQAQTLDPDKSTTRTALGTDPRFQPVVQAVVQTTANNAGATANTASATAPQTGQSPTPTAGLTATQAAAQSAAAFAYSTAQTVTPQTAQEGAAPGLVTVVDGRPVSEHDSQDGQYELAAKIQDKATVPPAFNPLAKTPLPQVIQPNQVRMSDPMETTNRQPLRSGPNAPNEQNLATTGIPNPYVSSPTRASVYSNNQNAAYTNSNSQNAAPVSWSTTGGQSNVPDAMQAVFQQRLDAGYNGTSGQLPAPVQQINPYFGGSAAPTR